MGYFKNIPGLSEMEKSGQWDEARESLYMLWVSNKDDSDLAIRLATECWYVLAEWEFIENECLNYQAFANSLKEVARYGLIHFYDDSKFLTIFGYMISMFPFFFGEDQLYDKLGQRMLSDAKNKNPNDIITKTLYLGSLPNMETFAMHLEELFATFDVSILFNGGTAIEMYFNEVIFNIKNVSKFK